MRRIICTRTHEFPNFPENANSRKTVQIPLVDSHFAGVKMIKLRTIGTNLLYLSCDIDPFSTPEKIQYEVGLEITPLMRIPNFEAGSHAFEHAVINAIRRKKNFDCEIGGISRRIHGCGDHAYIYFLDHVAGRRDLMLGLFSEFEDYARDAKRQMEECDCARGCTKCITSEHCANDNRLLDKLAAIELAESLLKL